MYSKKLDRCFKRIKALRLNFVNLKVNLLKLTEVLNKFILYFKKKKLLLEKLLVIFIRHDEYNFIKNVTQYNRC